MRRANSVIFIAFVIAPGVVAVLGIGQAMGWWTLR